MLDSLLMWLYRLNRIEWCWIYCILMLSILRYILMYNVIYCMTYRGYHIEDSTFFSKDALHINGWSPDNFGMIAILVGVFDDCKNIFTYCTACMWYISIFYILYACLSVALYRYKPRLCMSPIIRYVDSICALLIIAVEDLVRNGRDVKNVVVVVSGF